VTNKHYSGQWHKGKGQNNHQRRVINQKPQTCICPAKKKETEIGLNTH